jgi:3-oxoacyl-[acyl-carrier-protein] synthase-3
VNNLFSLSGLSLEEIDLFVFHQASRVVLDAIVKKAQLPQEKVLYDLESVGNTVSATLPIALKRALDAGRLRSGDRVMLVGFGVGYSWGGCLIQWK